MKVFGFVCQFELACQFQDLQVGGAFKARLEGAALRYLRGIWAKALVQEYVPITSRFFLLPQQARSARAVFARSHYWL
jgi:hypothetical protein